MIVFTLSPVPFSSGFAGMFWQLAKKSDWMSAATFRAEFNAMRDLVEQQRNAGNGKTIDDALKWLGDANNPEANPGSLVARADKWAAYRTHVVFTRGADASVAGEAIFSGTLCGAARGTRTRMT